MSDHENENQAWDEADSAVFLDIGRYAMPERETQIDTICGLIPAGAGPIQIVELCCGGGLLAKALLERIPASRLLAFDGSAKMLAATRNAVGEADATRLETRAFDLAGRDWRRLRAPVQAVVSSLAIHHLDGEEKRTLFADVLGMLAPGGVFVMADILMPAGQDAKRWAAQAWDEETRRRAMALDGNLAGFERFEAEGWNYFSDPDPDPVDKPSTLLDQLTWLRDAGFSEVDVFWMKAGHAVFGGRKASD